MNITNPKKMRTLIRKKEWRDQTAGMIPGFVQTNLVILPKKYAIDFASFCVRNPKPCPLLDISSPGEFRTYLAKDADLRTDLPRYHIYKNGKLDQVVLDLMEIWQNDFVSFLLGCSHSFEAVLSSSGIPIRYQEQGINLCLYSTNISMQSVGAFKGNVIVSMRPIPMEKVTRATFISARYPKTHGGPVHIGNPSLIGVDLNIPYIGDKPEFLPGDVPVFWACGVTPQHVALNAKIPFMITHAPGHMFVTDYLLEDLE